MSILSFFKSCKNPKDLSSNEDSEDEENSSYESSQSRSNESSKTPLKIESTINKKNQVTPPKFKLTFTLTTKKKNQVIIIIDDIVFPKEETRELTLDKTIKKHSGDEIYIFIDPNIDTINTSEKIGTIINDIDLKNQKNVKNINEIKKYKSALVRRENIQNKINTLIKKLTSKPSTNGIQITSKNKLEEQRLELPSYLYCSKEYVKTLIEDRGNLNEFEDFVKNNETNIENSKTLNNYIRGLKTQTSMQNDKSDINVLIQYFDKNIKISKKENKSSILFDQVQKELNCF